MGKAEPSLPARVAKLEANQEHVSNRLETIDSVQSDITSIKERVARLEERRSIAEESNKARVSSSTLLWTKIGVIVAVVLGGIGLVLYLLPK